VGAICSTARLKKKSPALDGANIRRQPYFTSNEQGKGLQVDRQFDDVENLLNKWAAWMCRDEPIAAWYPEKASGGFIDSWIKDDDELVAAADQRELESVNASVDSLSFMHKRVIYHMHGVGYQVWQFADAAGLYAQAKNCFRRIHFSKGG
jgi:hypothetical protein